MQKEQAMQEIKNATQEKRPAVLRCADLGGADLTDADLTDADLRDAHVTQTQVDALYTALGFIVIK